MLLRRYPASQVKLVALLSLLASSLATQQCLAEGIGLKQTSQATDTLLGGTPTRVDQVLSYAVVESLTLPPTPTESIILPAIVNRPDSNPTTAVPNDLDWKSPGIDGLGASNGLPVGSSDSESGTPEGHATDVSMADAKASSNVAKENKNKPTPVKVAARPKAPAEPRSLTVGPSLSISKKNQSQASDHDLALESKPRAEIEFADEQPEEPLLLQPQLTKVEPEAAAPIEQAPLDQELLDQELLEEESSMAQTSKPRHEARIAPKSGVTVMKEPLKPLNRSMMNLRSRMRTVLSYYYNKPLNNYQNDPWEVMHSMLSYELHSRVLEGGERGKPITAIGHLCFNRPTARKKMMYLNENGDLDVRVGVGLQGHKGQFLAMLAQCNVSPDYPIRVEGKKFTIRDLIEAEQRSCYSKTELTFKLIGLGHYLASDASWLNDRGEVWDIPRLIKEERTQKIRGAACGGTHRLSGLSLAYRRREARGEPLDGEYLEAAKFVSEYQSYAFKLQNSDGSLSTEWFRGRGAEEDIERRIRTTGHLLEWLAYSLPDEQLTARPTVRAVSYLTSLMATYSKQDWHKGSIAHALHALVIYDKRVFQPHDEAEQATLAVNPSANRYRGYSIYRGVLRGQQAPSESGGFFGLFGNPRSSQRPSSGRTR